MMAISNDQRVHRLLSQMSLDEKLAQIGSYWMFDLQSRGKFDPQKISNKLKYGIGQISRPAGVTTFDPVSAAKATNHLQKFLVEQTRLGIPAIFHEECCSGAMILGGTVFPQMIGVACSFRPELAEKMAAEIGAQLRAIGARQGLAPVLDVARDPRWGRVEETFGEDPTLVSHFGMAYVRGLQGKTLSEGVMATGKHFIGHSLSLGGLNCAPAQIGWNDLYNVYLLSFQAAIQEAGLASIMNSYPELDGEVVAASRRILTGLLRETLGFEGLLVSDYQAVEMIYTYHNAAADLAEAAGLALNAGIEVELPSVMCYGDQLKWAMNAGKINIETIDLAVCRHLQMKYDLGLFDNPFVDEGSVLASFETEDQRRLARRLALESMVLLKNDGTLPLKKTINTLAVIGPNADYGRGLFSDYTYAASLERLRVETPIDSCFEDLDEQALALHAVRVKTILEGIREIVSPVTKVLYARGCDNLDENAGGFAEALNIANQADVIILVLGDRSGLASCCTTGETRDSVDLRLPGRQEDLARAVAASGKPVVVVLVNGRPFAMPWLADHANAILEAWLPGEEGGTAIADTLFGDANPGGKLPITFPRNVGQVPIFYNHKPSGMKSNWHIDYVEEKVTPQYVFGHGLSYTIFEYSDLVIDRTHAAQGEAVKISVRVKNSGAVTGDEVVQLYTRDVYGSQPRPVKELKGYARLTLAAGETRQVTFMLPVDMLAFYDQRLTLVLEPGKIEVMVGSSSADIRLSGSFEISGENKIKITGCVFTCPVEIH
jgi:beta-glucosidase